MALWLSLTTFPLTLMSLAYEDKLMILPSTIRLSKFRKVVFVFITIDFCKYCFIVVDS
ncbi:hypothetical protein ES708_23240 [subsurface metagenome]